MTDRKESKTYHSFEGLISELLPNVFETKRRCDTHQDCSKVGTQLADEALEQVLSQKRNQEHG